MRVELDGYRWVVKARWYGDDRVIFSSPNVFACIRYVQANKGS